eukprot:gene45713-55954_t
MYFGRNSAVFKRHPTTLAIYKCLLEVFFVQQFLWIPYTRTGVFYGSELDEAPYYCNASALAGMLAFFTQISLLGSELCFFIISLDMRIAYTNPFSSYKHNRTKYLFIVLVASVGTAVCLMLFG